MVKTGGSCKIQDVLDKSDKTMCAEQLMAPEI